jgi:hypothetical protein
MEIESCREDRRKHQRHRLEAQTRLRPNEWSTIQVGVVDISSHGFRARCDANLKIGGYVTLEVHGVGLVDARIVWRSRDQFGAQFAQPIDLEHCAWMAGATPIETSLRVPDEALFELLAKRAARRAAM